jgi:hypothetical protein
VHNDGRDAFLILEMGSGGQVWVPKYRMYNNTVHRTKHGVKQTQPSVNFTQMKHPTYSTLPNKPTASTFKEETRLVSKNLIRSEWRINKVIIFDLKKKKNYFVSETQDFANGGF